MPTYTRIDSKRGWVTGDWNVEIAEKYAQTYMELLMTANNEEPAILKFFNFAHLPDHLQLVSEPYAFLAYKLVATLPDNAERSTALRKLLESKDCAVRANLYE